jgi:hypothetical protein
MQSKKKKNSRRAKSLILFCAFTAIVLTVSTYAWFIGMRTVNVAAFDVEIQSTESLMLSLDGKKWSNTVYLSKDTLDDVSYTGNTNSWGGEGLIPMSTIGAMDNEASRMILYEKSSHTATAGGYRLMSSRVNNYELVEGNLNPEQKGYVVFDLFIRNTTGEKYYTELNELNEEAIYLTRNSSVTVSSNGIQNTGIENSVRVAFTQIGRVSQETASVAGGDATITGITCTSAGEVTGICRDATIWEPNDTAHVQNAINWYNESCKARTGENVRDAASYSGTCGTIANGTAYPTYAVNTEIEAVDNVDVYDGESFNTYANTTKLTSFDYFTDTEKNLTGTERPTFMTLAPSSITKLRVYVYIEGQDIDNYDFAQIGKQISVKFGFTKERFGEEDIDYQNDADAPILPSTEGTCTGGTVPTTLEACDAAYGTWNENAAEGTDKCTGITKAYCDAIGGTFARNA